MPPPPPGSPWRVTELFLLYGATHSLLASAPAKRLAQRWLGQRARNGLYRPFFIAQSVVTTVWALARFAALPDRDVYRVPPPGAWVLRGVQAFAVALLLRALAVVGYGRLLGVTSLLAYVRGREPEREPEAQGPPPDTRQRPVVAGPFRFIRHPDNLFFPLFLWAWPRMTVNRLVLAILSTAYAFVGSWHEDARLRAAYGEPFARYQKRTPLFVPRMGKPPLP